MITINDLLAHLKDKLNNGAGHLASTIGYVFDISVDTAEFKEDGRDENDEIKRINGLLRMTSSEVTNLTDGTIVAVQNCNLRLIFRLEDEEENGGLTIREIGEYGGEVNSLPEEPENNAFYLYTEELGQDGVYMAYCTGAWYPVTPETTDLDLDTEYEYEIVTQRYEGYREQITTIREFLNKTLVNSVYEQMTDADGNHFAVTTIYQLVSSGMRDQVQELGDSYYFNLSISYMFVQNGLNTQDLKHYLDNARIPFSSVTVYKTPTTDGNVYAGGSLMTKNLSSQAQFSVAYEIPALNNDFTAAVFEYLFGDGLNYAHFLKIVKNGTVLCEKLVTFGETKISGETIANIGSSLTLIELPPVYDMITVGSGLKAYKRINTAVSAFNIAGSPDVAPSVLKVNTDGTLTFMPCTATETAGVYTCTGSIPINKIIITDGTLISTTNWAEI